jgi:hypothetical protein
VDGLRKITWRIRPRPAEALILTGGCKRGWHVFLSIASHFSTVVFHFSTPVVISFFLPSCPPLHAERLPHHHPRHHYNHYLMLVWICHLLFMFVSFWVYDFRSFKAHQFDATPASPAGIFPISVVLTHGLGATSNLCVFAENLKMKVEWTELMGLVCKSRCGAGPRSAPARAQAAYTLQRPLIWL